MTKMSEVTNKPTRSPMAKKGPSRRALLKAGGALLGGAAGAGAVTGFPTIWAQEIKDIELRHVGVSYSVVKAIGDQAAKDLGFKVTMQNLDTSAAINSSPSPTRLISPTSKAGNRSSPQSAAYCKASM